MRRTHGRTKAKARRRRPAAPPVRDPGTVRALDSEDQAGTYAASSSDGDTGESDEGLFAEGPLPPKASRAI